MKMNKSQSVKVLLQTVVASAMLFAAIPMSMAHAGTSPAHAAKKAAFESCVAGLQPAVTKGQKLSPAQHQEVKKCMAGKGFDGKKGSHSDKGQALNDTKPVAKVASVAPKAPAAKK